MMKQSRNHPWRKVQRSQCDLRAELSITKTKRVLKEMACRDRMNTELKDLGVKLDALNSFVMDDSKYAKITADEKELLNKQALVMMQYMSILEARIEIYSGDV